jgi:hypothetical protein
MLARKRAAAYKAHIALRGVDELAKGAQRSMEDSFVPATAIRRGWLGL